MKFRLLIVLLIGLSVNSLQAQIKNDDILHFSAGALSGVAGGLIMSKISDGNKWWSFTGAVASSLIAGIVKEKIDENRSGNWDNGDLGATVVGGITAGITINLFTGKKRASRLKKVQNNHSLQFQNKISRLRRRK